MSRHIRVVNFITMLIATEYKEQCCYRIAENLQKISTCINLLTETEIWFSPSPTLNSVGNLMQHLCGNISQYILTTLGGEADNRNRDAEFEISGNLSKAALINKLQNIINNSTLIIQQTTEQELLETKKVQVYELTTIGILLHVTEHLSYHTGQIVLLTKLITQKDLAFYAGLDLNKKQA